ncbi:hypothetical protein GLOTRDRAFT_68209 [Gloeophyllum trabeum ATCC 11539]|uniref:Ima1 N-terminal domain-containing protein n=1 Tax=Gloeophyllum trabeum (strain ATCC 11539 / FP-39264 / Madison 617) TaxID=670483 RepID=S7S3W6_GLOTA|nr:uncharacterized protein GLOTRDRAFT_68209 [Gloeophyllum trabeum ATCC 11539]EPQ60514.1 hypothetical protein GLOTRDRAFT_68209 [Gloeophyllum trabeum ATCC 11539]
MAPLLRRPTSVTCFFCNSAITPLPQNPRNFRCPHCTCWNRYDAHGEIMSDEPAMHDETLNKKSFSKRASPSKERFLSVYTKTPFCHACTTNQMLLTNLLANYLPPASSPEYEHRLRMLPEYKQSLYARYPPVCSNCAPAVEEEIKNKEAMARTSALGGWLKESKGKGKQRQTSALPDEAVKMKRQLTWWQIRGCLWVVTLCSAIAGNLVGALGQGFPAGLEPMKPALPLLGLLSLLWTAWDPTYRTVRTAERQGRSVRVQGKRQYNVLQMTAYLFRLLTYIVLATSWYRPSLDYLHLRDPSSARSRTYFTAMLILEVTIFVCSLAVLRLHQPAAIRLIDTHSHNRSLTPQPRPESLPSLPPHSTALAPAQPPADSDLLASLSLSSKPVLPPPQPAQNPVFGLPSLINNGHSARPSTPPPRELEDEDAMDWTPTDPSGPRPPQRKRHANDDDGSWLRPQRFFPPEQPTGLESLFPRIQLIDDSSQSMRYNGGGRPALPARYWRWALALAALAVMAGVGYRAWSGMRMREGPVYGSQARPIPAPFEMSLD